MAEIERFITVDWPPRPSSDGEWVRHSDHLAVVEEQAKTIKLGGEALREIERLKAERDEWRERSEIVDQARGNDAVEIERLGRELADEAVRANDAIADFLRAEQALPAELEKLAEHWEGRATRLEGQRGSRADTPVQIANRSGAEFAFREAASRLRERAAELREGAA